MTIFVGRFAELRKLQRAWSDVAEPASARAIGRSDGPAADSSSRGQCVILSGSMGVGKTRLLGEARRRAGARCFFYAAGTNEAGRGAGSADRLAESAAGGRGASNTELAEFAAQAAVSALPHAERFRDILAPDWDAALRLLADAADDDEPTLVVLDNVDALVAADRTFAQTLRRVWQHSLSSKPILLVLSGRDPSQLVTALRNVDDAVTSISLEPFNPGELADILALEPAAALDAHIVTGGHADLVAAWPTGTRALDALATMLSRSPSLFELRAELFLAQTLGLGSQAEAVIAAAGPGESSRAALARRTGLPPASLDRALKHLADTRLMIANRPVSLKPSREARYRLADPYLRFWLRTIAPRREQIARGDMDSVVAELTEQWPTWRREAMSVVTREAMNRLAAAGKLPGTGSVGGYWNRFEDVRVDLVGTDQADDPQAVTFVGALKWDAHAPFDHYDVASLISIRQHIPGVQATTPLVAVSLGGSIVGDAVAAVLGPDELLSAWTD